MEKDRKSCKSVKLAMWSQSELLWWKKIGKVAIWVKLTILSQSELLQWEKIGKVMNRVKLAIPSQSEPLQWEKWLRMTQNNQFCPSCKSVKLAMWSQSELLWRKKIGKVAIWVKLAFQVNLSCFSGKDWKS